MREHPIRWQPRDTDPPDVRARLASLNAYMPMRLQIIRAKVAPHMPEIVQRLDEIQHSRQKVRDRLRSLWELADHVSGLISDSVACKRGCSHCCHCAVMLPKAEAELIGQLINRKPADAPPRLDHESIEWGYHNPCTFLSANGECSIYEFRPLECRLMFSADVDDLLCQLRPPHTNQMPLVDMRHITQVQVGVISRDGLHFADIREWFPREVTT